MSKPTIAQLRRVLGETKPKKEREYADVREQHTTFATFFSIETGSECNRSCTFCPVSHYPREGDEYMSDEMFDRILDQLVEMRYSQRIALYSYNEPLRDARLPDLIARVRARLPRTCVMINSNGDYFKTSADIQRLYDAGLNQMQINVYCAADGSGNPERIARGIESAKKRYAFLRGLVDALPHLDQEAPLSAHRREQDRVSGRTEVGLPAGGRGGSRHVRAREEARDQHPSSHREPRREHPGLHAGAGRADVEDVHPSVQGDDDQLEGRRHPVLQ
jgi:hypothetical protein